MPNLPYYYEVNWQLVTGNGSLTPICSLSKRSLSPNLNALFFTDYLVYILKSLPAPDEPTVEPPTTWWP